MDINKSMKKVPLSLLIQIKYVESREALERLSGNTINEDDINV